MSGVKGLFAKKKAAKAKAPAKTGISTTKLPGSGEHM
jgi:hypothetical protein